MSQVLLIGAGQLGSRHLQAMARLPAGTRLSVIDPMPASLEVAKARFAEMGATAVEVSYATSLDGLPRAIDVAIVATGARERRAVVESLLAVADVRYLVLEKVLFQRAQDYDAVAALLAARGTSAWVNCPRRLWPHYRALNAERSGPVHVSVTGSDWGLGCNAIHFVDLAAWLGGDDDWRFSIAALDGGTRPSRRAGYLEVTGTLTGVAANGSRVTITSQRDGTLPVTVMIEGADFRQLVREGEGKAWVQAAATAWRWSEIDSPTLYQSQLTDRVVLELLSSGTSSLTPLWASTRHHLAFLSALSQHMGVEPCPIT